MPSASLAVAYRPSHVHLDKVRVAALSAAIALNLAALLTVMRPLAPQLATAITNTPKTVVSWITPEVIPPPPPPIDMQVVPKTQTTAPRTTPKAPTPPAVVPTDAGNIPAPPVVPTIQPAVEAPPVADAAPIEATLAYRTAPLTFPSVAIRRKLHGTVMLRVLVDAEGKPTQVVIDQSSGSELLDKSAREQVLANWRFQPATLQGHAVQAWARVPVSFELREL